MCASFPLEIWLALLQDFVYIFYAREHFNFSGFTRVLHKTTSFAFALVTKNARGVTDQCFLIVPASN